MFCTQCGGALQAGQRFCTVCGQAMGVGPSAVPLSGQAPRFRLFGLDLPVLRLPGFANAPPWAPYAFLAGLAVAVVLGLSAAGDGGAPAGPGQYDAASGQFMSITGAIPAPVDIPIQNLTQETEVWCWAAVAQQIILASQGPQATPPQCALVAMANGAAPEACCSG